MTPSLRHVLLAAAGIVLLTFAVYAPSLGNDFVRWDDGLLIYENPIIRDSSFRSIGAAFTTYDPELYIPLTLLSYKLDYALGGTHPFIYHLDNLLLHAANAVLVMLLVFLLSRSFLAGIAAGILFAMHPLNTEAVAWASARKDLLSTFFFLGALLSYLRHQEKCGNALRQGSGQAPMRKFENGECHFRISAFPHLRIFPWLSLFLFLLALLAKVMAITLPLALLLLDLLQRRRWSLRMLQEKLPFFALSAIFGVIALYGKRGVTAEATFAETVLVACKSTVFYLLKFFVPIRLSVLYPYTEAISLGSPDIALSLLIVLALIGVALTFYRSHREVSFGIGFFLLMLVPTFVNFSKGGDIYFASDRYAYLPMVGLLFLVALVVRHLLTSDFLSREARARFPALGVSFLIIGAIFAVLTLRQSLVWKDSEALFRNVLRFYPPAHRARNNLGNVERRKGNLDAAVAEFQAGLAVKRTPKALANLGAVLRKQGKIAEALSLYKEAIALAPDDPEPHFGLGIVYVEEGRSAEAQASYEHAIALDPRYAEAMTNLGALFASLGKFPEAILWYRKAIAVNPFFAQAHYNLAVALVKEGKPEEALAEYRATVRLAPEFLPAYLNLGILLYAQGLPEESREQFEEVLRLDPGNSRARSALEQMGEG